MTDPLQAQYPTGESRWFSARDGTQIHVRDFGPSDGDAVPLVCLPGLTRNSRDFAGLAAYFAGHDETPRRVYAFDFRGRGLSGHDSDWKNYTVPTEAGDVIAGLDALGIHKAVFVGTSRGGLVTMALSAMRPGAIAAAVLNDIGPVIEATGLAQIRMYLKKPVQPRSWSEAIAVQKEVMAHAFPAFGEADWAFEVWARYREIDGAIQADYDPALARTLTEVDLGERLPEIWPQFDGLRGVPVMVIRGETSQLLSETTVARMAERHPALSSFTASGQGHAPMLHAGDIPHGIDAFIETI